MQTTANGEIINEDWEQLFLCQKCNQYKTIDCFNMKKMSRCRDCWKIWWKEYRKNWATEKINKPKVWKKTYYTSDKCREYRKNKRKELWFDISAFRARTRRFVKRNNIHFDVCLWCWEKKIIQIHHPSYDGYQKRSYIVPLCCSCHRKVHTWNMECPEWIELKNLAKDKRNNDLFYKWNDRCRLQQKLQERSWNSF